MAADGSVNAFAIRNADGEWEMHPVRLRDAGRARQGDVPLPSHRGPHHRAQRGD
jgi:hypothetical protein